MLPIKSVFSHVDDLIAGLAVETKVPGHLLHASFVEVFAIGALCLHHSYPFKVRGAQSLNKMPHQFGICEGGAITLVVGKHEVRFNHNGKISFVLAGGSQLFLHQPIKSCFVKNFIQSRKLAFFVLDGGHGHLLVGVNCLKPHQLHVLLNGQTLLSGWITDRDDASLKNSSREMVIVYLDNWSSYLDKQVAHSSFLALAAKLPNL